ncbi:MAG: DsbA family protein [Polyangia bacterium]
MRASTIDRGVLLAAGLLLGGLSAMWVTCSHREAPETITARQLEGRVDLGDLTPREIKRFETVVNSQVSPCGDALSLAAAIRDPSRCPLAPLAGRFVTEMLMKDYDVEEVSTAYVKRYAAAKGLEIPINGSPSRGAGDPSITIVVFSDFECPFCAETARKLERLVRAYPEHTEVVFKHFVLGSHPASELMSRAAFAAGRQDAFWEMHDTLFSAQGSEVSRERIETMATGLGLDLEKLREDISSTAATAALEADRRLGEELGVPGTPTLFINGRMLDQGARVLDERIEEELLRQSVLERRSSEN